MVSVLERNSCMSFKTEKKNMLVQVLAYDEMHNDTEVCAQSLL